MCRQNQNEYTRRYCNLKCPKFGEFKLMNYSATKNCCQKTNGIMEGFRGVSPTVFIEVTLLRAEQLLRLSAMLN